MSKIATICLALLLFTGLVKAQAVTNLRPVMDPGQITANLENFRRYESYYMNLEQDYTALSTTDKIIPRAKFLDMLMTGRYLPVKMLSANRQVYFKLVRLKPAQYKTYGSIVQDYARPEQYNVKLENKSIPNFSFTDLNGKTYTKANTKGKILVLKCWFIKCQACNEEMPQVNQLASRYKNRKDILFISLATDPQKNLKAFMATHQFNYAVIPGQQAYITNYLHVYAYPTHLLVNKEGKVILVTSYVDRLSSVLSKVSAI